MSDPVIGRPSAPPQALAVAVSDRLADAVRASRRRQFTGGALVILGGVLAAGGVIVIAAFAAGAAYAAVVAVIFVFGASLALGTVLRPRRLELGRGLVARGPGGGVSPLACLRGALLLASSTFHEAFEGFAYGSGLIRHDPAVELAAWIVLALAPPHGPGPGVWSSLEGVDEAGVFSLPGDFRPALGALESRGWVEVDRGRYPPRVRLEPEGLEFVKGLVRAPDSSPRLKERPPG